MDSDTMRLKLSAARGELRAGVIGAGWVATARHIPALMRDERVRVAAVYDPDIRRACEAARRFDVMLATDDINELLSQVDIVSVCTPPASHAARTLQALEAGRHVLVEKPMAMSMREAQSMVQAADERDLRLCVSHNLLYSRSVRRALQELRDAGPLQHIVALQLSNPRRRLPVWYEGLPGGLFYDESPHVLYLLRRFLGVCQVEDVRARLDPESPSRAVEFLEARLCNGAGVSANLTMSFNSPVSEWRVTLIAARKVISLDLFRDIVTVAENDGRHGASEVLRGSLGVGLQGLKGFLTSGALYATNRLLYGHERLVSAFVDSVLGGPSAVALKDSLAVMQTMQELLCRAGVSEGALTESVA